MSDADPPHVAACVAGAQPAWSSTDHRRTRVANSRSVATSGSQRCAGHLATIGDPAVSRLHAVLQPKPTGWCVQATSAVNGLFVNGTRLAAGSVHLLSPGDELRLGERTAVIFHSMGAAAARSVANRGRPTTARADRGRTTGVAGAVFTRARRRRVHPPASVSAIADDAVCHRERGQAAAGPAVPEVRCRRGPGSSCPTRQRGAAVRRCPARRSASDARVARHDARLPRRPVFRRSSPAGSGSSDCSPLAARPRCTSPATSISISTWC